MEQLNTLHINSQPPTSRSHEESGVLAVHSVFYTIQGEGPFAGRPAVFVRLNHCNLQCPGCDTDYTAPSTKWEPVHLAHHVVTTFEAPTRPLIIVTGGEPFRQNLSPFIAALQAEGCKVQIETNGTLPLTTDKVRHGVRWTDVTIICSPKTGRINKALLPFIHAYKYVLAADVLAEDDGLPLSALGHPARPRLARPIRPVSNYMDEPFPRERVYVQPVDPDPDGLNLQACLNSCSKYGYTLCLQIHKIVGVP